ncbi:MAG: hypothetical protein MK365_05405 [Vicinamibacterales bacterium]|nr:hypothetical protein [Vicinamibacterales bacterium]
MPIGAPPSKALQRVGFVVEHVEHLHQLGNFDQLPHPAGERDELERALVVPDGDEHADQLAETGAVHVGHVGQVQQELGVPLREQRSRRFGARHTRPTQRSVA